eukprot:scaffold9281_cov28-Cyclotella_meneghiniana.AAC.1
MRSQTRTVIPTMRRMGRLPAMKRCHATIIIATIALHLIRHQHKLMRPIMNGLGIRQPKGPSAPRRLKHGMIRLRPPAALQFVILPLGIGPLQHLHIDLEGLLAHVLGPHEQLHGLDVVGNGHGPNGFVALRVDLGGRLPNGVVHGLTFHASLRRQHVHAHVGREGRIVLGVDLQRLRTGAVGVFKGQRGPEGRFAPVHEVDVGKVRATDGAAP